jgi:hypothetical protein
MNGPRNLVLAVMFVIFAAGLSAANDIYFAPTSTGSNNGTSCANAYAYNDGTHGWSLSAQQVAGNNLHICSGTYTASANGTLMTFVNSGSSGSPITLIADQGAATFTSPYFNTAVGAITNTGTLSYVVVNGDGNLTIQNTANGTSLANHQQSYGVWLINCTYCTVENTTVQNISANNGSSSGATDIAGAGTAGIQFNGAGTGALVTGNTISAASAGVVFSPDGGSPPDASNITISDNTISNIHWGLAVAGGDSTDTMTGIIISGNDISNWTNWYYPASAYHQDGMILYNVGNPSAGIVATISDNYVHGDFGDGGSPTGEIYCADFSSCTIFNNLLVNSGSTRTSYQAALMWLGQSGNWGKNMLVYNNTMIADQYEDCIMLTISGKATIENNICLNGGNEFDTYQTTLAAFEATITSSNHNVWYNESYAVASQATGFFTTYATWQGAGYDANSSTVNPSLTGSYLIPNTSSSAYQIGANLISLDITALDSDKAGNPRPGSGAWAAGAYQLASSGSSPAAPTGLIASVQ